MINDRLSLAEARRIALAAQGFDRPRPGSRVNADHLRRTIKQLGLLQIDYVNVLAPAQYQVPFSRLGPYDRSLLDDLVYRRREFTEHWAHEASILPVESWPLLRYRMDTHRVRPWGFENFIEQNGVYVAWVAEQVRSRGPLTADQVSEPEGTPRRIPGAWHGSYPRAVLEAHFARGVLAIADRKPNFARAYDLAERVIPPEHWGRDVPKDEAKRELLKGAARALGIASKNDLADYYRMSIREASQHVTELVEAGDLREVQVEGWKDRAYLHSAARLPRAISASTLLSPFDPVVWYRPRVAKLFEFDYRLEIWVPQPKRRWGYYVLPFLFGDRLVARVDLKADRAESRLMVLAAYSEGGIEPGSIADALAVELGTMGKWLGLDSVVVERRGGFARALGSAVRDKL
jgi:uncharacterized protein YcaQ